MLKGTILFFIFVVNLVITSCMSCNIKKDTPQPTPTPTPTPAPTVCETRGTWLWASSIETSEKRINALNKILAANLNTVFVSIPPVGNNEGRGDGESFLAFIREANSRGLSVHAWMENARRKGKNDELDFRNISEQEAQAQWVMDLMSRYGTHLDGVHLDYIRFLHSEEVNSNGKMDGVSATIRKIRDRLNAQYPSKFLTSTCMREAPSKIEKYSESPQWEEDVPQWFRNWYAANPGSIYHGPTNTSAPMHMKFQQNPVGWLQQSLVTAVMPMRYTTYDDEWRLTADIFKSFNVHAGNDHTKVIMGVGWIEKSSPTSHKGYDAAGVVRKIKYGRSIGLKGFVIFILCNHDFDDTPLIQALTVDSDQNENDAPFETSVPSCLSPQSSTSGK